MTHAELLERRAAARAGKRESDDALLRKHATVVERFVRSNEGPEIRAQATRTVDQWERERRCDAYYVRAWRRILALPTARLAEEVLRADDEGIALRQNSPFGFLLRDAAP